MDWVTKRYYSLNSIVRALQNQKTGKKDNVTLEHFSEEKKYTAALIVGGGPGAVAHADALHDFINTTKDIVVIHASSKNALSFEKVSSEQIFCLVGNEGHRMEEVFGHKQKINGRCVLPPFPRKMGTYIPASLRTSAYELNEVSFTDKYEDSHTALALQTAIELGVSVIYVTGYDGYEGQSIGKKEQELFMENEYLFRKMKEAGRTLYSITPTTYKELEPRSVYASVS
ncbi:MAG: hypothetical protein EOP49_17055 [Sphingobacteriales bacterium]|nr:MAG: hypothetical protein EOP49_17055 [Sphingobacteriales bacterium]